MWCLLLDRQAANLGDRRYMHIHFCRLTIHISGYHEDTITIQDWSTTMAWNRSKHRWLLANQIYDYLFSDYLILVKEDYPIFWLFSFSEIAFRVGSRTSKEVVSLPAPQPIGPTLETVKRWRWPYNIVLVTSWSGMCKHWTETPTSQEIEVASEFNQHLWELFKMFELTVERHW